MRISVHAGHNRIVQGANYGSRKEHIMARAVKDKFISKLRLLGHTVYDDTDEIGTTKQGILNNVVKKVNSHTVDIGVSIHLNAFNTKATGVEVFCYSSKEKPTADKFSSQLSKDIGWHNRGGKIQNLYVITHTKCPMYLFELGFIDNDNDMAKFDVDQIVNSMIKAVTGESAGDSNEPSQQPSYRINIGDFDSIEWTAAALTKIKELLPSYGVWTQCLEGGYHRIIVGDFSSKQWADETLAKVKTIGYGAWIQSL